MDEPNHFELASKTLHIVYDASSISGERRLTINEGEKPPVQRKGNEITLLDTQIGWQVSVILDKPTTLTLLLPVFNLKGNDKKSFKTLLITTRRAFAQAPGTPILTYSVEEMQGTAEKVIY